MFDNLYSELQKYSKTDNYPYHMPGHKRKAPESWKKDYPILHEVYQIDITEIDGFDNLHQAEGILYNVQQEAAVLYGAEESFFLVNGSTCGILAAIACAAVRGERVLMARNCHRSVYHAVYLLGLTVSYLYPEVIPEYGIADAIRPEAVEEALKSRQDIAAVIITSPTYEGIVSDIGKIADITHKYGKPLIVDEAHGAHFGFHPAFPENAIRQGGDIVIHSVHKMLPAMTQTALLHVSGGRIDRERLKRFLRIYQTSSPSYVLMASIDACMKLMQKDGGRLLGRLWDNRADLDSFAGVLKNIKLMKIPGQGFYAATAADPGKALLSVKGKCLTGNRLYHILRERYHLQMEMAADTYALAMFTIMDGEEGFSRLKQALHEIDGMGDLYMDPEGVVQSNALYTKVKAETAVTITQAMDEEAEWMPFEQSGQRISAGFLNLYPPGIPFVVPGERIGEEAIKAINHYLVMGLNVQGMKNGYIKLLKG